MVQGSFKLDESDGSSDVKTMKVYLLNARSEDWALSVFGADEKVFLTYQISFHDHSLQANCPSIQCRLIRL